VRKAIEYVGRYLRRAVMNGLDLEARTYMALAATIAGIGFGNAGVHIPHGLAYPVPGWSGTTGRQITKPKSL